MKLITALLALNLFCGVIYHYMVVRDIETDARAYKELYKACENDRMWKEMQIKELGGIPK